MALNTVSSDRLSTNVKNTNFTAAEKQDLTDDILPLAGQLGNRNLIINGAMQVAQRGTSSSVDGYSTIDRFRTANSANNENPSQAQVDVASGTTPYTLGFRKAFKLTNGNQTGGVSNADADVAIRYSVEAQDLAQSGWNHKSTSSFITLSFWVKASVAQNYYGYFLTLDGTTRIYPFETGSLTADTWTKVTKIIPGNSILDVTNDNGEGLRIEWRPYTGTNKTDSGVTLNAWATFASATRTPVSPTGWYTTNDATFEITGVQLEVGSVATDFEHRSFAQELQLCKRYYYDLTSSNSGYSKFIIHQNGYFQTPLTQHPVEMRAAPTITFSSVARRALNGGSDTSESVSSTGSGTLNWQAYLSNTSNTFQTFIYNLPLKFDAEL